MTDNTQDQGRENPGLQQQRGDEQRQQVGQQNQQGEGRSPQQQDQNPQQRQPGQQNQQGDRVRDDQDRQDDGLGGVDRGDDLPSDVTDEGGAER